MVRNDLRTYVHRRLGVDRLGSVPFSEASQLVSWVVAIAELDIILSRASLPAHMFGGVAAKVADLFAFVAYLGVVATVTMPLLVSSCTRLAALLMRAPTSASTSGRRFVHHVLVGVLAPVPTFVHFLALRTVFYDFRFGRTRVQSALVSIAAIAAVGLVGFGVGFPRDMARLVRGGVRRLTRAHGRPGSVDPGLFSFSGRQLAQKEGAMPA